MTKTMTQPEFVSTSPEETFEFASKIGRGLKGGEIFLFKGGLGAGKTLFIKGLLAGLGFDPDEVTSPSFALVNLYRARLDCYHIDLWRLEGDSDPAHAVGLEEILENPNAIIAIEWSERLFAYDFGRPVTAIEIQHGPRSERTIYARERPH